MAWECAECRQPETDDKKITTLCHHCGKLLCSRHSVAIVDDVFADFEGSIGNIAYHCSSCKKAFHPRTDFEQIILKN